MKFQSNMGNLDRGIRLTVAIVLLGLVVSQVITGWVATAAAVLAAIFIITSTVSFCPLYLPFGFSSKGGEQ